MRSFALTSCALFLFPMAAHAGISISEIMYDAPGSDENAEWVEIKNQSDTAIDLAEWRFLEGGVHHKLKAMKASVIEPHGYAVIVRNAEAFLSMWPAFSGILFTSSFSLNNTGETLSLVNPDGVIEHSATYSNAVGNGDGTTIHFIDGGITGRAPTPGTSSAVPEHTSTRDVPNVPTPSNHVAEPEVGMSEAIDEGGMGDGVYAVSYYQDYDEKKRSLVPWFIALGAVILVGIVALALRKPLPKSGYTIIEDNS